MNEPHPIEPRPYGPPRLSMAGHLWAVAAAFGTYFCMYGFRKPFTAAGFEQSFWGVDFKTLLVTSQVMGYMLSKFIGVKVVSEIHPDRRAKAILLLIVAAEVALLLFGVIPAPYNLIALFLNGLPLGIIFGLVLGYLEGRRATEALAAGLCASFILADGVVKSVGAFILEKGVPEHWMPFTAGLVFLPPIALCVWMLNQVPPPDAQDIDHRSERVPLNREQRWKFFGRYTGGLVFLLALYLFVTIIRSVRADFAPEIWEQLGQKMEASLFARSETLVAIGALLINGLSVLILNNRRAFFASLGVSLAGLALAAVSLLALQAELLGPFPFMVLLGTGLYLPYVAVHTTIFERLLAMTRDRANIPFLLYVADAAGYLGYIGLMLGRGIISEQQDFLKFFTATCWVMLGLSLVCLVGVWLYFWSRPTDEVAG